jgi:hypothetical protein
MIAAAWLLSANLLPAADAPKAEQDRKKEARQGFVSLFDGKSLEGWQGSLKGYAVEDGVLVCQKKGGGQLYTKKEYADFIFRFEFKLEPAGNNGVGIRTPMGVDAAYHGMEIQILDDTARRWAKLRPYQYHGSIYGVVPAKRGHLKKTGRWNSEEIVCRGSKVRVTLNGTVIVDADLSKIEKTPDGRDHPGLHNKKGYIGFLGHGSRIELRNLRIRELKGPKKPAGSTTR